jgi:hypothetical protein
MTNLAIEYLTDAEGNPKAVVIPIELWRKLLPQASSSLEKLAENLEDYCLSKAMEAAKKTPLLNRQEAIEFLAAEEDD